MDAFLNTFSYLSAVLLALISITNFVLPHIREFIANHKRTRFTVWLTFAAIGSVAVYANVRRDSRSAADRAVMTKQISELIEQTRTLTAGQAQALDEARGARQETASVRSELSAAQKELGGEISKSAGLLSENINQYRTDTTTAVGRLIRPGRTLGPARAAFVHALKSAPLPHAVGLSIARGNQEALDFGNEIIEAFKEAGWTIKDTQMPFITKDGNGVCLVMKKGGEENLNEAQKAVALAFKAAGFQMNGAEQPNIKDEALEIYIGLQEVKKS
jgi:hypothetical protein